MVMGCIGYYVHNNENIAHSLDEAQNNGFEYIMTPLSHPIHNEYKPISDVILDSQKRQLMVIYIHRRDYTFERNVVLLHKMLRYVEYLGVSNIVIEPPVNEQSNDILIEIIKSFLNKYSVNIYIKISLVPDRRKTFSKGYRENVSFSQESENEGYDASWRCWDEFRMKLDNHQNLQVALELNSDVPDEDRLNRWLGEVVGIVIMKTDMFVKNAAGAPVFALPYQHFIKNLLFKTAERVSFAIKGNNMIGDISHYIEYLKALKRQDSPQPVISRKCREYEDVLQTPLQPLKDNLNSSFYEIFEADSVKYRQYYLACCKAFSDMKDKKSIIVMVLGAGRGPLVEKALDAARDTGKYVLIYALDKNENAIVTLGSLLELRWNEERIGEYGKVELINEDMRVWETPQKADIIITELLGSFGDNELSPECLDGVYRYVHSKTISIPCEYTSYIAPVQSQKLFFRMRNEDVERKDEQGYVVHARNYYLVDKAQPVFRFQHDNLELEPEKRDNSRSKVLKFAPKLDTTCHGFLGFFDCCLYKDIRVSTEPATATPDMISWFPIYFPIERAFQLKPNVEIELDIRRLVDDTKVWYEWKVNSPIETKVHNKDGAAYSIGLQIEADPFV